MRLWSIHPKYLDARGLVALWREGLLARKVLRGETKGYRHHPQLERFRQAPDPQAVIDAYLAAVCDEADRRGYAFDRGKIGATGQAEKIDVTDGQIEYEWRHLMGKLERRDAERWQESQAVERPEAHPLFRVVGGEVEAWERSSKFRVASSK